MNTKRALASLLLAAIAVAMLPATRTLLPPPRTTSGAAFVEWWTELGTAGATMSILRLVGLGLALYLAALASLVLLAGLTRRRLLIDLSRRLIVPGLGRILLGGGSVILVTTTAAAAPDPARPAGYSITDLAPADSEIRPPELVSLGARSSFEVRDLGPIATLPRPAAEHGSEARTEADLRHPPQALPHSELWSEAETWVVAPGDHLWSIAAETLADRSSRSPGRAGRDFTGNYPTGNHLIGNHSDNMDGNFGSNHSDNMDGNFGSNYSGDMNGNNAAGMDDELVHSYWLRLIEANRDLVAGNPDLIHPGQVIRLP